MSSGGRRLRAFVLMPFSAEFNSVYEKLIRPPLAAAGYEVMRADSFLDQHNVMRDVIRGIAEADLIVAEVTIPNANVYYELGVAHALARPTVLLTQSVESLPFDLKSYRAVAYSTHFAEVDELTQRLTQIAEARAAGDVKFGSPVTDFLPAGEFGRAERTAEAEAEEGPPDEDEPPRFLDSLVDVEAAVQRMNDLFEQVADSTNAIGDKVARRGEQLDSIDMGAHGATVRAQRITAAAAKDMREYARELDGIAAPLDETVERVTTHGWNVASSLSPDNADQREQLEELKESMEVLLSGGREGREGLLEFRDSVASVTGVTRDLDRASSAVRRSLARIIGAIETVEAFAERVVQFADENLGEQTREEAAPDAGGSPAGASAEAAPDEPE